MAEINAKYKSVNDDEEADDDDNDNGKVPPPDDRLPLGFGHVRIVLCDVLSYCYYYNLLIVERTPLKNARSTKNWIGPAQCFPAETDRQFSTGPRLPVKIKKLKLKVKALISS